MVRRKATGRQTHGQQRHCHAAVSGVDFVVASVVANSRPARPSTGTRRRFALPSRPMTSRRFPSFLSPLLLVAALSGATAAPAVGAGAPEPAAPRGHLLVIGGGDRPASVMQLFATPAGGAVASAGDSQKLTEMERNHNLLLPSVDRRILALARQITAPYTDDYRRARAVENYLRTQYKYSLAPLEREPADPLAHFLFERREGHCEYYASAMAVMLRAVWVPARVATGFLGGTRNPISGWHVVRASDAHAWVEAWIPGRGWIAFDPTPPAPEASPLLAWSRLSLWADAFDTFWQEWVLGYDLDRQLTLAFQVDRGRRSISLRTAGNWWKELEARLKLGRQAAAGAAPWAALGLLRGAGAAFGGPWLLRRWRDRLRLRRWQRGEGSASDAALLYRRMLALLERQGHRKPPAQTPLEFARSLPEPALAKAVESFTRAYHELRYGGRPSQAARMAELLETLQPRRG